MEAKKSRRSPGKPAAGRLAPPVGDAPHARAIDPHHVLLIAWMSVAGTLQRQPLSVVAEVRLGILATEGYLTNGSEMILARGCLHHTR